MKLSNVIRLALEHTYGIGPGKSTLMCFAITHLHDRGLISINEATNAQRDVQQLVKSISYYSSTMLSALRSKDYIAKGNDIYPHIPYTTELYVWWCFDLIRKGL